MLRPTYDVIVTIGLDFGSSTTKVCYRIQTPEIDKNGVVKFSSKNASPDGLLLDSVVYVADNLQFISHKAFASCKMVRYLKADMIARFQDSKNIEIHKLICSYFIAYIIGAARDYIENIEDLIISRHQVIWIINLGVPVAHEGIEFLSLYEEMVKAAVLHHKEAFQFYLISMERWRGYYVAAKEKTLGDMHYHLTPELLAEVIDVFEDFEVDDGLAIIVDVGSATVDIAVTSLDRHSTDVHHNVDFVAAKVSPLGVDSTVRYVEDKHGTSKNFPVKKALMNQVQMALKAGHGCAIKRPSAVSRGQVSLATELTINRPFLYIQNIHCQ